MTAPNAGRNHGPEKTNRPYRKIGKCVAKASMALAALSLTFWLLWNWAAVPLFTFPSLTFLQALGAILLTGVLVRMGRHMTGRNHRPAFAHQPDLLRRIDRCRRPHKAQSVTFGDMMW